jgi:hypothetical protein
VLSLWYYFWDAAAWTNAVTGTCACAQAKQECIGQGTVSEVVPQFGGWAEYQHVLSLNRPHWSAPHRPKKTPDIPKPVPVQEPKPPAIVGYGYNVQAPGQVVAWGENIDVELELIAAIMAVASFDEYTLEITVQPQCHDKKKAVEESAA